MLYLFTEQSKVLRALGYQDFRITHYMQTLTPVPLWDQETVVPRVKFTWKKEREGERGRKSRRGAWRMREAGGRRRMQEKREMERDELL